MKSLFHDLQGGQDFSKTQQQIAMTKVIANAAAMTAKGASMAIVVICCVIFVLFPELKLALSAARSADE